MSHARHKVLRTATTVLSSLVVMMLMVACGAAPSTSTTTGTGATSAPAPAPATSAPAPAPATSEAVATTAPAAASTEAAPTEAIATAAATEAATAAAGETATDSSGGTVAVKPTGVPEITCQSGQKEIVWMVRNDPVENAWESNIARPAFSKANPTICLRILSLNQDDVAVKREAMIASGEKLDVWSPNWGGNGFANDYQRTLVADLTPLIQRDNFDTSVFIPGALATYQRDGKTWGLPLLTIGSYIYYNQKLFDASKVAYPTTDWDDASWTWDKFVSTAKQLTKNTDDINNAQYGANSDIINGDVEFPPMMWGHYAFDEDALTKGYSDKVTLTDDASIKAFTAFHDLVFKDKVAPDPAATQALSQLGGAFASGKVAMQMSGGWGHWAWKDLINDPNGFCWGAAPMPMGTPDAKVRTITFTDPWVITANLQPDEQDLAWTFLKFLVSPDQAKAYSQATGAAPTQLALLDDFYKLYAKCMKPEDMKKVFEGAFTHGKSAGLNMMLRADELGQIWANDTSTYFSDPNGDVNAMAKQLESDTSEAETRIKSEVGK